jgi:hypothetical protein
MGYCNGLNAGWVDLLNGGSSSTLKRIISMYYRRVSVNEAPAEPY